MPYGLGFYIVSERLLSFLEKNGFDYNFDKSIAYLVNTKGNLLTDETFYLVRIIGWKIKEEVVYPDLANPKHGLSAAAYTDSHRDILLTRNYCYLNTLIVNKDLKDEILTLFRNPFFVLARRMEKTIVISAAWSATKFWRLQKIVYRLTDYIFDAI